MLIDLFSGTVSMAEYLLAVGKERHPTCASMLSGTLCVRCFQLPARRWNDAVHAQVFHHLSVVVVGVRHRVNRKLNASVLLGSADSCRQHRSGGVLCRNGGDTLMQRCE